MENRDKDKMSQRNNSMPSGDINRGVSQDKSKSDSSTEFGQKIGQPEKSLNEPSSRTSDSTGSSGMKGGTSGMEGGSSKLGKSSDLDSSSNLGSSSGVSSGSKGISDLESSGSKWNDSDKGTQGGSRH